MIDRVSNRVRLWPLDGSTPPVEMPWKWDRQPVLEFSPDGRLLASASPDGSVLVWDSERLLPWRRPGNRPRRRADCEECWANLSSSDARLALGAIEELASDPERAVRFLAKRLRPPDTQDKQITRLVADLDSDEYHVRKQADTRLHKLGEAATEQLRAALASVRSWAAQPSGN
jgi:hypothetical protein